MEDHDTGDRTHVQMSVLRLIIVCVLCVDCRMDSGPAQALLLSSSVLSVMGMCNVLRKINIPVSHP